MSLEIGDWVVQDGYPSVLRQHAGEDRYYGRGVNIYGERWAIHLDTAKHLTIKKLADWILDRDMLDSCGKKDLLKEATLWLIKRNIVNLTEEYESRKSLT